MNRGIADAPTLMVPGNSGFLLYLAAILFIIISGCLSSVLIIGDAAAEETTKKTRRIEASYSFESLSPNDAYGNWHTGNLALYSNPSTGFTYFVRGSFHSRQEGDGVAGTVGAYKDWANFLYTVTSVTAGNRSDYLPRFRFDNDVNFKFGLQKNYVFTFGLTSIDYFTGYSDLIVSGGPTIYWNRCILQYRLFFNKSDPGAITSNSHLISVGYGKEGWQWTYLNFSFGKQAYLATSLSRPQSVNNSSYDINLQHRHWLGHDYGILGNVGYFKLEDGYEKVAASCGVFYEF